MYTFNIGSKKIPVSATTFWILVCPFVAIVISIITWYFWMLTLSSTMFSNLTGIPVIFCGVVIFVSLVSFVFDKQEYRLLPKIVAKLIEFVVMWSTVYYQFKVTHASGLMLSLMMIPLILTLLVEFLKVRSNY